MLEVTGFPGLCHGANDPDRTDDHHHVLCPESEQTDLTHQGLWELISRSVAAILTFPSDIVFNHGRGIEPQDWMNSVTPFINQSMLLEINIGHSLCGEVTGPIHNSWKHRRKKNIEVFMSWF